jgi:hypothetical protein
MMLVLVLVVVAAILFGHGYLTDSTPEVVLAGALALLGIVLVLGQRWMESRRASSIATLPDADDDSDDHAQETVTSADVVFVPGRMTFHDPSCSAVAGKPASAAGRASLAAGGMKACRRCLPDSSSPPVADGQQER